MLIIQTARQQPGSSGEDKDPIAVYLADIFTVLQNLTGAPGDISRF